MLIFPDPDWFLQCAIYRPVILKQSSAQGFVRDARFFAPLGQRLRYAVMTYSRCFSPVVRLLAHWNPATILRVIALVDINTLNRKATPVSGFFCPLDKRSK